MTSDQGAHLADFAAEYRAIVARAQHVVAGFPPLLRDLAEPLLPQLYGTDFAQIAALLPCWVAQLLDGLDPLGTGPSASPPDQTATLGLANLLGWWFSLIQDWLLDRDLDRPELLPLALAFHAALVRTLEGLLPGVEPFWAAFEAMSLAAAEAHIWEQRCHFQAFADLDGGIVDCDDLDRLADRAVLLQLSTVAQFVLHGHTSGEPRCLAVREMLHHYAVARQIGDDHTDWIGDLQNGRLNYVSARILRRMVETGAVQSYAELDVERVVGYYLYDGELFADIERVALAACQKAAHSIAPYAPHYLGLLVDTLTRAITRSHQQASEIRHRWQDLFSSLKKSPEYL